MVSTSRVTQSSANMCRTTVLSRGHADLITHAVHTVRPACDLRTTSIASAGTGLTIRAVS